MTKKGDQITLEPMSWNCRIGEANDHFLAPFTDSCRIDKSAPDTVRITALSRSITLSQAIELGKKLKALGFEYAVWERYKPDGCYDVRRKL